MQFDSNGKGASYSLYTGLANLDVVLLNPSLEQIQEINPNAKREPVYITADGRTIVEFYLSNKDLTTRVAFTINNDIHVTIAGDKTQFINDCGQSIAAPSIDYIKQNYEWFSLEGIRPAYVGEIDLMVFIRSWLSVKAKGICRFTDREAIFNGNLAELIKTFNDNKLTSEGNIRQVKCLLGVNTKSDMNGTKRYQQVYQKYFEPSWMTSTTTWENRIGMRPGSSGYKFTSDYQNSLEYKKYEAVTEQPVTSEEGTGNPF